MRLRPRGTVLLLLFVTALIVAPAPVRAQVGVNVYGASYHFDTEPGDGIRNFNPGAGVHWTFDRGSRAALELSAGVFHDSFGEANRHWALGARVVFVGPIELGAQLVRAESPSVLDDMPHMGVLPFATVRGRRVAVHALYMPEVTGVNRIRTLGFMATVYPWGEGWDWGRRGDLATRATRALEFRVASGPDLREPRGLGFAWRRMFDRTHGLRLGVDLAGELRKVSWPAGDSRSTEYEIALSVQYLRTLARKGRLAPFWTAGVRTRFYSRANEDWAEETARESVVAGVGADYGLGGGWSLMAEYEADLSFRTEWDDFHSQRPIRRRTQFSSGVHLGIVAPLGGGTNESGMQ